MYPNVRSGDLRPQVHEQDAHDDGGRRGEQRFASDPDQVIDEPRSIPTSLASAGTGPSGATSGTSSNTSAAIGPTSLTASTTG
jgi:hypothetical protein